MEEARQRRRIEARGERKEQQSLMEQCHDVVPTCRTLCSFLRRLALPLPLPDASLSSLPLPSLLESLSLLRARLCLCLCFSFSFLCFSFFSFLCLRTATPRQRA